MPGYRSCAEALIAIRSRVGGKTEAAEDPERAPLTYDRLVLGALVLGRAVTAGTPAASASACCCRT